MVPFWDGALLARARGPLRGGLLELVEGIAGTPGHPHRLEACQRLGPVWLRDLLFDGEESPEGRAAAFAFVDPGSQHELLHGGPEVVVAACLASRSIPWARWLPSERQVAVERVARARQAGVLGPTAPLTGWPPALLRQVPEQVWFTWLRAPASGKEAAWLLGVLADGGQDPQVLAWLAAHADQLPTRPVERALAAYRHRLASHLSGQLRAAPHLGGALRAVTSASDPDPEEEQEP